MAATFILADSARIRYLTGAMMYFAQGIPQGLLAIAIPAWLAAQGVGAGDIGSYMAVIVLPWAFKLVTGPFMDRFQFRAMGRRRPWVLAMQLGLSLSLLGLTWVDDPVGQLGLLMTLGVIINSFAATQDVAVDGMAIDLTPVREQGRLNAYMSFGKAIGWAATAAASGLLLVLFGLQVTAVIAAVVSGAIFLAFAGIRERSGERLLPWTSGEAVGRAHQSRSFADVFRGINEVLWQPASLVVLLIMLFDGLVSGYGHALMPVAAVNVFGYTAPQWSQLVAVMGLVGAGIALVLGPMIDRFGAKRMLVLAASLVGLHAFILAQTQYLWQDTAYVRIMLSIWVMMIPVVMVCVIALGMAVCSTRCSATQFAIYMSTANLGHSLGAKIFGMVVDRATYDETYKVMAMLVVAMLLVLFFHRQKIEMERENVRREASRHTLAFGGSHGGQFWSGAMRCPKCRSDMEQVVVEGVEVDRCLGCHGLWFDAGEAEALSHKSAAATLDDGRASDGRHYNIFDEYRCPRCGAGMARVEDARQHHIWYETCRSCQGNFFDAGEFRDLSEVTVADFFRDLMTPRRH